MWNDPISIKEMEIGLNLSNPITLREYYDVLRLNLHEGCRTYAFVVEPDGRVHQRDYTGRIDIVCGSFNPLHEAHKAMYHGVTRFLPARSSLDRAFEISLYRHHKPFLTYDDLVDRLKQFEWYAPVIVTGVARYEDKIEAIGRNASPIFHIGYDTAERLLKTETRKCVEGMRCSFVVYQRCVDGKIRWTNDLPYISNNIIAGSLPDHVVALSSSDMRNKSFNVAWAILRDHDHYLLVQRAAHDDYPFLWCFPGGQLNEGEPTTEGASRELLEETGYVPDQLHAGKSIRVTHVEPDGRTMHLHGEQMYGVESRLPVNCDDIAGMGWFSLAKLDMMQGMGMLAPATVKVLDALKESEK